MADNASETSGISANPMAPSGQVQPFFTMAGTGGPGLQIVSEKLSETNYASWAVAIELYVEDHDKLDILHGSKVKPDEKDPSFRTWRPYDMWKTLEQMYGRRHDMLRIYQLSSQIFKLEQGSMSVTNYFATLKGLWDEFDYYQMENWSSTDDHQRYLKLLEKDRIIKFLDGLNAEFENLKGQILGLDPTPSLEQVYYKILSEEGRRRTMNNKGISTISPPIGETSVFIGSANKFRPGGTKGRGDRFCRHCKRTNHDSDFCWEKYPEKKPEKFKHNAKKAPNSGATDHMTNAANSFISYSLSSGQEKVIIADGTKATVAGKGSIKLTDHFFLSSALHDLETKQTIGTGREVGGLYYYQLETTSALKSAAKCCYLYSRNYFCVIFGCCFFHNCILNFFYFYNSHSQAAGNQAFKEERHLDAIKHYSAVLAFNIESHPFAAICLCNHAAAYQSVGQITDAIADCSVAIALDATYPKALSRRASLYERITDYEQASNDLRRLVSLLEKQIKVKDNQAGTLESAVPNQSDLCQARLRLSITEEEARKDIPLDMYLILGIESSSSVADIKKAYRKAALRHHPDKAVQILVRSENLDKLRREVAEEVHRDADRLFKMIGEAYAVLLEPARNKPTKL
ncbi:hypothetical protein ZIOFF_022694 [Zingiber officinale]|uniref:J domain-containing protein n=1 Tax=Zingiber officinale TaxID=94328 RepID=A0A8J5HDT6_ZINOF|nr:hypothetical protein ZIOFF_022694 [Zingiber officinale]